MLTVLARVDAHALAVGGGVLGLLAVATVVGQVLRLRAGSDEARRTVENLNARIYAWWAMAAVFGLAIAGGVGGACVLFGLISFLALREMITLTPTRRGDHHTLFWAFFAVVPIQYYAVYVGWYGFYSIFIPVYASLLIAVRSTLTGDYTCYMERVAKIQSAVMICVYAVSHAPAVLTLHPRGMAPGGQWRLLVFLVVVVQLSDVLQYVWGKLLGRRPIAPHISPNKTWEGFIGGVATATLLAAALYRLTPFGPARAGLIGLVVCIVGFFGGIVMSAIKRDAGVKDFGHLIAGHGGMMDRVDSLSFAAPIFFHVVRYWYVDPVAV